MQTRFGKILALTLAFCLQAQALAAVLLPCSHQADPAAGAVHACHGLTGSAQGTGELAVECDRCTLISMLGVYDVPQTSPSPLQVPPSPVATGQATSYHGYSAETPHRPPIPSA